ncbi:MAG: hypothetical protein GX941_00180 [Candidatus Methanofastidiosa archaeon]|nr:hypothetical protein [Candidatus Methanofastidiosa archaeon]
MGIQNIIKLQILKVAIKHDQKELVKQIEKLIENVVMNNYTKQDIVDVINNVSLKEQLSEESYENEDTTD